MERASEKTEDTFINIPIYTESHNLSILGNLYRQTRTPAGKRDDISLREKEAQIKKDLNDGIDTVGGKMTVCQLYDKKNSRKRKNIKRATEKGRQYLMNALKNDPLGMRAVDTVKQSDAKEWAIRMSEKGYAYKTIDNYKRSLKASFYMAIQDDCIRKNPFEFKLSDVLEDDTERESYPYTKTRKNACLPLWKRTRFTVSIMMRLCFFWKRDFVFLNFAD